MAREADLHCCSTGIYFSAAQAKFHSRLGSWNPRVPLSPQNHQACMLGEQWPAALFAELTDTPPAI